MAKHIFSGVTPPTTAPLEIGHHYIDTVHKISYIAVGTSSAADWHPTENTGGTVNSVFGRNGNVVAQTGDYTKAQVGLGNVDNTSDANKPVSTAQSTAIGVVQGNLTTHVADNTNPHAVTKAQVGLGLVDNTADLSKPVSTPQSDAIGVVNSALNTHEADHANPHVVTKLQIGLGNVDDTKDLDKPISDDTQGALDLKADLTSPTFTGTPKAPTPTAGDNSTKIATTAYVDNAVPTVADATTSTKGIVKLAGDLGGTADLPTVPGLASKASASALSTHIGDTANPHSVTKTQVGLGNADNTADADKPISAAQALADTAVQNFSIQRANHTGSQPLSTLSQSGATTGQKPEWNGTAWVPVSPSGVVAWGDISGTLSDQTDLKNALDLKANLTNITGNNNSWAGFNSSGDLYTVPNWSRNSVDGLDRNDGLVRNNDNTYITLNQNNLNINALQNSDNDFSNMDSHFVELDTTLSGFNIGINSGSAVVVHNTNIKHVGKSNTGGLSLFQNNFEIGNGTDAIDVKGLAYSFGFGTVRSGVTLSGSIQGYGFQPHIDAGVNVNQYTQPFYDGLSSSSYVSGYTSFNAGPNLAGIKNNFNYNGFSSNPTITDFQGNASFTGFGLYGNLGTFGTGGYTGVQVNPTIASVKYAVGLDVSMANVTTLVGTSPSVVIQDITITVVEHGSGGNGVTFEFVNDATAGSEHVSGSNPTFQVHIQSGVSTATQVKAALDSFGGLLGNVTTAITGVASNPQVTQAPTATAGGVNDGSKKAANFTGDVHIDGSLEFTGELSIGKLNAFNSSPLVDGGGNPRSIHQLITQPTAGDNETIANVDLLGLNTAMLLTVGHDSHLTSAFIGVSALGLPAVINMGSNSTIDRVAGATFAVSLGGSGTGAVIDSLDLCRSIAIPDGVTAINKLVGYKMDLPFGDPGTQTWGVYIDPAVANYFAGSVKIGVAGGDVPATGFKLDVAGGFKVETTLSEIIRASSAGLSFFGNAAVAQQTSSGAATAGAVYTSTEQTMIQEMYNALRTYGLLT